MTSDTAVDNENAMEEDTNGAAPNSDNNANADTAPAAAAVSPTSSADQAVVFSPELLQMYYARLFPYSLLYKWLSYGNNTTIFKNREFSFTLDMNGEEVYIRYQSFGDEAALSQAMLKRRPVKVDIGAVYEKVPDKHASQTGKNDPAERELVFDIDLTDYDGVRQCGCSGAAICPKCWDFMTLAIQVMDQGLRADFGFKHIAWFYSGRRGVHAWVCDAAARALTDEGRSAVAKYFEIELGTDKNKEVKVTNPLHPMMSRAFEILEPAFIERVLPASGHGILATPQACQEFLQELPAAAAPVREKLSAKWNSDRSTPAEKWAQLKQHLNGFITASAKQGAAKAPKNMATKERSALETWPVAQVFKYTYPRLDINVSKMRNHLLKSPFCVHPKTGRVCVPIQVETVEEFDPFQVPTLPVLMRELDEYSSGGDDEEGKASPDWKKTSLKKYFDHFQKDFLEPMVKEQRRQERDEAEQKAAMMGDF